ncbi:MAG TPA: signal peptidase II [Holophagaceae bacterium]|nr:signal peptidase II [Holophagaceae bacterium]
MKRPLWLLLPGGVLALDLGSKLWILSRLREGESLTVIPGFFNLSLGFNTGAIFGSLQGLPEWARFTIFTVAGIAALIYFGGLFLREDTPTAERTALGLILGGALGNGLDRLLHGHVVDFLDFVFGGWHYWTFNLADTAIVCGALLFGACLLLAPSSKASASA